MFILPDLELDLDFKTIMTYHEAFEHQFCFPTTENKIHCSVCRYLRSALATPAISLHRIKEFVFFI